MIGISALWKAATGANPLYLIAAGAAAAAALALWLYVGSLRDDNATLSARVGTLETQRAYLVDTANANADAAEDSRRRAAAERASAEALRTETNRTAADLARALEINDHAEPTGAKCTLADRAPDALVDALRVAAGVDAGGVRQHPAP